MNFSISGDNGGLFSGILLAVLIILAIGFLLAIFGGLWRTREGAPTIDEDRDPET